MGGYILKKAGTDFVMNFAKSVGTETGKRVVNGKPPQKKESDIVKAAKEVITIFDHPYRWDNVHKNFAEVGGYVKLLAPVAGFTVIGWISLPVIVGATTFAIAGTSFATMAYGITNVTVVTVGASKLAEKVNEYPKNNSST